jgi:hypothetical protein
VRSVPSIFLQPSTSFAASTLLIADVHSNYIDPNDVMSISSPSPSSDYIVIHYRKSPLVNKTNTMIKVEFINM